MRTFKDFFDIKEDVDTSLKNEIICRDIARIISSIRNDKHIRKAEAKGQRESTKLTVYMQNGDVYELIPKLLQNILSR